MSTLIMTIDSDSDNQQEVKKSQKKPHKGKKAPQVPIPADDEDIIVNKDFNLEDIFGHA
jgi:hypothetical protein